MVRWRSRAFVFCFFLSFGLLVMDAKTMASDLSTYRPLPYNDRLDPRSTDDITLVVLHATELPDLATARTYGERIHYPNSGTGNSGHFYIDRDGSIEQWVSMDRVAHHVKGHNLNSIGIELVSLGRYPNWYDSQHQDWQEPITEAQLQALVQLVQKLQKDLSALTTIAGHDQLDQRRVEASDDPSLTVSRKLDPGPDFPWQRMLSELGLERFEAE